MKKLDIIKTKLNTIIEKLDIISKTLNTVTAILDISCKMKKRLNSNTNIKYKNIINEKKNKKKIQYKYLVQSNKDYLYVTQTKYIFFPIKQIIKYTKKTQVILGLSN